MYKERVIGSKKLFVLLILDTTFSEEYIKCEVNLYFYLSASKA